MKKENYIPFSKEIVFEKHLESNHYNATDTENLKKLFHILEHFFHYKGFGLNQDLKLNYAHFDPDRSKDERELYKEKSNSKSFKKIFEKVIERGNFETIEKEILDQAISESDLIGLNLSINFEDFQDYKIYARGLSSTKETIKKFFFWKKEVDIEYYDRVVLFLHYNSEAYFTNTKKKYPKEHFSPNSIILKIFKRVPKNDLETIFPNAIPKMSLMDKLLLWIPGIGGGVPILTAKVLPALLEIENAYKTGNLMHIEGLKTSLAQSGVALGVLGIYLFRQYKSYQNKKNNFQKMLTDSLYFKNLGNNGGVFHTLIDASEEEEIKESILAYSFLYQNNRPTKADDLDEQIENWFENQFNCRLDFDVQDALAKLQHIGLAQEKNSYWTVLPIEQALKRVDEIWDGIFDYNNGI
jgi:hypothetical protein